MPRRQIKQLTLGGLVVAIHPSIAEAARAVGISLQPIIKTLQGKQSQAGGWKWQYLHPSKRYYQAKPTAEERIKQIERKLITLRENIKYYEEELRRLENK